MHHHGVQFFNLCLLTKNTTHNTTHTSSVLPASSPTPPQCQVTYQMSELMRPVGWTEQETALSMITPAKPCSICVKMTTGSLIEYNRNALLHCGISDSEGQVHHFDEDGHHSTRWQECVSIPILALLNSTAKESSSFIQQWNESVQQFHTWHTNQEFQYHTTEHNCFHYVVGCLKHFGGCVGNGGNVDQGSSTSNTQSTQGTQGTQGTQRKTWSSKTTSNNTSGGSGSKSTDYTSLARLQNVSMRRVEKRYVRPSMLAMETYLKLLQCINKQNRQESDQNGISAASTVELFATYCNQMNEIWTPVKVLVQHSE
jgi:hypothetical protein